MSFSAVIVGSNYPGTSYPLKGCLNDVNFLKTNLQPLYKSNIVQLSDGAPLKPTRSNILSAFTALLENSKSGDTLFFGYSGHGSNVFDKSGDERDKRDEVIVTSDQTYISDDEFKSIIDTKMKPNTRLFCVFDSCFSGSILDLPYQYLDADNKNKNTTNSQYKPTNGQIILISGCRDSQTSLDAYINKSYRGAMLWSFLQTLSQNPKCSYSFLLTNMRSLLKKNNYSQIPQLSSGMPLNLNSKFDFF